MKKTSFTCIAFFIAATLTSACGANPAVNGETPGDREYYDFIEQGIALERLNDYENALAYYNKALNVNRFELPSYYVLLDIGRVLHKMGRYSLSVDALEEYMKHIDVEIRVERGEILPTPNYPGYGYTEKGYEKLLSNRAEAEALMEANKLNINGNQPTP